MNLKNLAVLALCFAGSLAPISAFAEPAASAQGDTSPGERPMAFLTPELRYVFRQQHISELRGLGRDERRAYMQKLRDGLASLSDTQKQKLRDDLQAKWNSLSSDEKQSFQQRIADRRSQRRNARSGARVETGGDDDDMDGPGIGSTQSTAPVRSEQASPQHPSNGSKPAVSHKSDDLDSAGDGG